MRLLSFFVSVAIACGSQGTSAPAARPDDFELAIMRDNGAGMGYRTVVRVSAHGGELEDGTGPSTNRGTFPIGAADLDAIYAEWRAARFDPPPAEPATAADAPAWSIEARAAGVTRSTYVAGGHTFSADDQRHFDAIAARLDALVDRAPRVTLTIVVDPAIADHVRLFTGSVYGQGGAPKGDRIVFHVLPGEVAISAQLDGAPQEVPHVRATADTVVHAHLRGAIVVIE